MRRLSPPGPSLVFDHCSLCHSVPSDLPTEEASPGWWFLNATGFGIDNDPFAGGRSLRAQMNTDQKIILHMGRFLAMVREGDWEYVERVNAAGACLIVAVTDEGKLILAEQYRIPLHARTIELPAGIIGDDPDSTDESHAEAARRELLEETGYRADHLEVLTTGAASSGVTSEVVTLFRARGLKRVGSGGGVAHEDITVHEVSLGELDAWLEAQARAGVLVDPKVYAGLYFLTLPNQLSHARLESG